MSDVGSISNSLASSLLSAMFPGSTPSTNGASPESTQIASDVVSLLGGSSPSADSSIYSILGGSQSSGSTDPMYDLLLSAENASMVEADPSLLEKIAAADQSAAGASPSAGSTGSGTTSTQALVQQLESMNLLTMSPNSLFSLLSSQPASESPSGATPSPKVEDTV